MSTARKALVAINIPYYPALKPVGKSVVGCILLRQMFYWSDWIEEKEKEWKNGVIDPFAKIRREGEFYKFIQPCEHTMYKEKSSWCEELGFGKKEFINARDKIAIKSTTKTYQSDAVQNALISYRTDLTRVTWWKINRIQMDKVIDDIFI